MKNIFWVLSFVLLPIFGFSQGFGANVGYEYIGKNAGFAGLDYRFSKYSEPALNAGAGVYVVSLQKKINIVPEIHLNYNWKNEWFTEVSLSSKNFKPSVGFNFLNATQLKFGYSFGFNKEDSLNGISVGVHFNIGGKHFYDYLRVGF